MRMENGKQNNANKRAFVRYRLAVKGKTMNDLSKHMGWHPSATYQKLEGIIGTTQEQKNKIDKFIGLNKKESEWLWEGL